MLFDTLELSRSLQPSFTPEQAEALVHALGKASGDQLATKADVIELKADNATAKAGFHGEFSALRADTKALEANLTS